MGKTLAQRQGEEIDRLRQENAVLKALLDQVINAGEGSPLEIAKLRLQIAELLSERDKHKVQIENRERYILKREEQWLHVGTQLNLVNDQLLDVLPWDIRYWPDGRPVTESPPSGDEESSKTQVGVTLVVRSIATGQSLSWKTSQIYDAPVSTTLLGTLQNQIPFGINRSPAPVDIGDQDHEGLDEATLLLILRGLATFRYTREEELIKGIRKIV